MVRTDAKTNQRLPLKRTAIKVIALDFDGTLVESNNIKDQAFETIFSDWPDHQEAMMEWHLAHNAIDRQEKFRYFVEEILALPGRDDLIEQLTTMFSQLTRQLVIDCPFVDGAQYFIKHINGRVAVYLISATPESEIINIINQRGLDPYFKNIYGAPIKKYEILKKIMIIENATTDEILFIGDTFEDQQAAKLAGMHFIGRQSDRPLNKIENNIFFDFYKIKDYLMKFYALS